MATISASRSVRSVNPKSDSTCSPVIGVLSPWEKNAIIWSSRLWASRMPPSAARAIAPIALSLIFTCSESQISRSRSVISRVGIGSRSNRWQREMIVGRT